jgi:hypothetical protein
LLCPLPHILALMLWLDVFTTAACKTFVHVALMTACMCSGECMY